MHGLLVFFGTYEIKKKKSGLHSFISHPPPISFQEGDDVKWWRDVGDPLVILFNSNVCKLICNCVSFAVDVLQGAAGRGHESLALLGEDCERGMSKGFSSNKGYGSCRIWLHFKCLHVLASNQL